MNQAPVDRLNARLLVVTKRYFRNGSAASGIDPHGRALTLRQLRPLLEATDALRPHRHEITGLPFDRLLLNLSPTYRSFRDLSRRMGIHFTPELASRTRALTRFDPLACEIGFAPTDGELRWAAGANLSPELCLRIANLLDNLSTPSFHESSHMIFFRLLRPRKSRGLKRSEIAHYFMLVESLAKLADVQLASELGAISRPLSVTGVLYPTVSIDSDFRLNLSDLDQFRSVLLYSFFTLSTRSNRLQPIVRAFREAGFPFVRNRALDPRFPEEISPAWETDYLRRSGGRIRLPALPRALRSRALFIDLLSPAELLHSKEALRSMHRWFLKQLS